MTRTIGNTKPNAADYSRSTNIKSYKFILSRLAILASIVGLILWKFDLEPVIEAFDQRLLFAALATQVPMLIAIVFAAYRHAILVRVPPAPFGVAFRAIALSGGLNIILPARLSELVKISYMRHHIDIPYGHGLGAVVAERLGDLIVVGGIAAIAIAGNLLQIDAWILAALLGAAVAGTMLLPWLARGLEWFVRRAPWRIAAFILVAINHAVSNVRNGTFVYAMLLGAIGWAFNLASVVAFMEFQPFGSITLVQAAALFTAVTLAGAVPMLPGGFGAYEGAAMFILVEFGFPLPEALAVAVTMHVSQLFMSSFLTPIIMLRYRTGLSTLLSTAYERLGKNTRSSV